jgi:multidrug resistance efflux pump
MSRPSRIVLPVVAIVSLLQAAGFAGTYLLHSRHYISTDNAQVDGDRIDISAPATGTISGWDIGEDSPVRAHQVVGRIRLSGSGPQPVRVVRSPGAGTVAINNTVNGEYVTAGAELATAYDNTEFYATARVADTDIGGVRPGQLVDMSTDSSPATPITGIVQLVQNSAASVWTVYPSADAGDPSNPQKVDQYVPVKIAFTNTGGVVLVPGMNLTVHIHKG